MANSYKQAIEQAKTDIRSITAEVKKLEAEIAASSININKSLNTAFNVKTAKQLTSQLEAQQTQINQLNEVVKKLTNTNEGLAKKKKELSVLTGKELVNNRALARSTDLETRATSKLAGAYANLNARHAQAKKSLRDLIVSQGKNSKETKKAQREFDRLTKKVNLANKATSNFSNNGLGKMVKGFRNLVGGFGIVLGVQLMADFTRAVFNNLKTLDKLDFSLKAILKNEGEVARTRAFLNDITIRYGAELVSTTERYIKFAAAARQSGLELKETEEIFETVTEAAGVMGLKTDELTGIYLALEQMLSKGKVTTEELRRQLGERLPGAFGIMAKALGVTTVELDKMLRAGEVLSSEALPKFTKELEKAFSLDKIDRVRTLQASFTNLTTSWQMFMENLRTGQSWISTVLMFSFDNLSLLLRDIGDLLLGDEKVAENNMFAKLFKSLQDMNIGLEAVEFRLSTTKEALDELRKTNASDEEIGNLKGIIRALEAYIKLIKDRAKEEAIEKEELINRIILKDKSLSQAKLEAMSLDELKVLWSGMNEEVKKGIKALEGSISAHKNLIKILEEKREKLATNQKEYQKYTEQILEAEFALIKLETAMKGINSVLKSTTIDDVVENIGETLKKLGIEELKLDIDNINESLENFIETNENGEEAVKAFADSMKETFGTVTNTFADIFDIDVSKFDFIFDELVKNFDGLKETSADLFSKENVEEWANLSVEAIGTVLDASLKRYEVELQEAQIARDLILNNDLASEEQKEEARREFEEKERDIKNRKAKQERKNTLIKIAVDTAAGVAKTLAEAGPAAPFIIPTIIGIGLAQAAFVSAQPLPKFAKGTENAPEGWAITQEKRPEPITDKYGNLKTMGSKGGDSLTYLQKGDKVYKSEMDYMSSLGKDDINRAIWNMNLASNGRELRENQVDTALLRSLNSNSKSMIDTLKKKKMSMKINQTINLGDKFDFLNAKNNTL